MLLVLQAVVRQGTEAVSVRLGALCRLPQAQLDGFKSRALRAAAGLAPVSQPLLVSAPPPAADAPYIAETASAAAGQYFLEMGENSREGIRLFKPTEATATAPPTANAVKN